MYVLSVHGMEEFINWGYLIYDLFISEPFLFPIMWVWEVDWHYHMAMGLHMNGHPQTVNTDMWVMIITCDIKHGFKQVYKLSEAVL